MSTSKKRRVKSAPTRLSRSKRSKRSKRSRSKRSKRAKSASLNKRLSQRYKSKRWVAPSIKKKKYEELLKLEEDLVVNPNRKYIKSIPHRSLRASELIDRAKLLATERVGHEKKATDIEKKMIEDTIYSRALEKMQKKKANPTDAEIQAEFIEEKAREATKIRNEKRQGDSDKSTQIYSNLIAALNTLVLNKYTSEHDTPRAVQTQPLTSRKGFFINIHNVDYFLYGLKELHVTFIYNSPNRIHVTFDVPDGWNVGVPKEAKHIRIAVDNNNVSVRYVIGKTDDHVGKELIYNNHPHSDNQLAQAIYNKYVKTGFTSAKNEYPVPVLQHMIRKMRGLLRDIHHHIYSRNALVNVINTRFRGGSRRLRKN